MISSCRTAFPLSSNSKKPVEQNLNTIVNQCQIKMKELIMKKQDYIRKTNILVGKNNTLQEEIAKLENDIQKQKDEYEKANENLNQKYQEIEDNKKAYEEKIKEANEKEALFKEGINQINQDLALLQEGTLPEQSIRRAEIKKKCEEIIAGKEEQTRLEETLYKLTRELGRLEIELDNAENNEERNIARARNGIKTINQIYEHQKEFTENMKRYAEEVEEEGEHMEEVEEEKNQNIKENIDEEEPKVQEEVKPIEASSSHSDYHKSEENLNSQGRVGSQKETEAPKQTAEVNTQEGQ